MNWDASWAFVAAAAGLLAVVMGLLLAFGAVRAVLLLAEGRTRPSAQRPEP